NNGARLWQAPLNGEIQVTKGIHNAAIADGRLYISPSDPSDPSVPGHELLALDGASGQVRWTAQLGGPCIMHSGGVVYVATADACEGLNGTRRKESTLFAMRATNGTILWHREIEGDLAVLTFAAQRPSYPTAKAEGALSRLAS